MSRLLWPLRHMVWNRLVVRRRRGVRSDAALRSPSAATSWGPASSTTSPARATTAAELRRGVRRGATTTSYATHARPLFRGWKEAAGLNVVVTGAPAASAPAPRQGAGPGRSRSPSSWTIWAVATAGPCNGALFLRRDLQHPHLLREVFAHLLPIDAVVDLAGLAYVGGVRSNTPECIPGVHAPRRLDLLEAVRDADADGSFSPPPAPPTATSPLFPSGRRETPQRPDDPYGGWKLIFAQKQILRWTEPAHGLQSGAAPLFQRTRGRLRRRDQRIPVFRNPRLIPLAIAGLGR